MENYSAELKKKVDELLAYTKPPKSFDIMEKIEEVGLVYVLPLEYVRIWAKENNPEYCIEILLEKSLGESQAIARCNIYNNEASMRPVSSNISARMVNNEQQAKKDNKGYIVENAANAAELRAWSMLGYGLMINRSDIEEIMVDDIVDEKKDNKQVEQKESIAPEQKTTVKIDDIKTPASSMFEEKTEKKQPGLNMDKLKALAEKKGKQFNPMSDDEVADCIKNIPEEPKDEPTTQPKRRGRPKKVITEKIKEDADDLSLEDAKSTPIQNGLLKGKSFGDIIGTSNEKFLTNYINSPSKEESAAAKRIIKEID